MVTPTRPDGHIAFSGNPIGARTFSGIKAFAAAAGITSGRVERGPARLTGDPIFVAHPPNIGTGVTEHNSHWHQLAHQPAGIFPIIVSAGINLARFPRAAVKAVAAVGAVEPHSEDIAIMSEELTELIAIISNVLRPGVILVITIPGGEIDSKP